jgi:hypothetical protein
MLSDQPFGSASACDGGWFTPRSGVCISSIPNDSGFRNGLDLRQCTRMNPCVGSKVGYKQATNSPAVVGRRA